MGLHESARIFLAGTAFNLPRFLSSTIYFVSRFNHDNPWADIRESYYKFLFANLAINDLCLFISLVLLWVTGIKRTREPWVGQRRPNLTEQHLAHPPVSTYIGTYPEVWSLQDNSQPEQYISTYVGPISTQYQRPYGQRAHWPNAPSAPIEADGQPMHVAYRPLNPRGRVHGTCLPVHEICSPVHMIGSPVMPPSSQRQL
jgi:hypothetical protein